MMEKKNNQANEPISTYEKPLNADEIWKLFKETDQRFKETEQRFKETDQKIKETSKNIDRLENLFTSQWGKLVESLVEGDIVNLLKQWGIEVQRTIQNVEGRYNGHDYEFDIIAVNSHEIVIVEVKTTLRPDDVKHFFGKLHHAKQWMQEYRHMNVYGAMAYLKAQAGSAAMAMNKGLFAIRATGNSAHIINDPEFKPKVF